MLENLDETLKYDALEAALGFINHRHSLFSC